MEITVKNFGIIENLEMHVEGLTVITGPNDTGKSTFGKILFSLVKAFSKYKEDLDEDKESRIMQYLNEIYFSLRRSINVNQEYLLREFFQPRRLYNEIRLQYKDAKQSALEHLKAAEESGTVIPSEIYQLLNKNFANIEYVLHETEDQSEAIKRTIKKVFYSEFKYEMLQKGGIEQSAATIQVRDGATQIVDIRLQSNGIIDYQSNDDLGFSDATYVDSPAIIQFNQMIRNASSLFDDKNTSKFSVPLHLKDLSEKLSDSVYSFIDLEKQAQNGELVSLLQYISSLVDGNLNYDVEKQDFVLKRNEVTISSINIATGIKSLSIIDLLVKSGSAKSNSLLILDEPEVNLHPKWQIAYCDIITRLVKLGVSIIVTTHSPYVVDALKKFCDREKINNHFYFAHKKENNFTEFMDITDNISIAIDFLAEPLSALNEYSVDEFFD